MHMLYHFKYFFTDTFNTMKSETRRNKKGRTQYRELPLCAGSGKGCQWQALPSPVQCEKTTTRTRDLPVTDDKTPPLAPSPSFGNKKK